MIQQTYHSEYPVCVGCNIMYAVRKIHNGKCTRCRETHFFNSCIYTALAVIALITILAGWELRDSNFTEARCIKNGDWLETPYCNAVARDMENV